MTLLACVASGLALLLLLTARGGLNNLSPVALAKMAEEHTPAARLLRQFLDRKPSFLLSLQVGILAAAASLAFGVEHLLRGPGAETLVDGRGLAAGLGAVLAVVLLAQLGPALDPERALAVGLPFLRALGWVLTPLVYPMGLLLSRLLEGYLRRHEQQGGEDKEEEIAALINVGQREGILEGEDSLLVQSVLEFGDTVVREVMTPRTDMVCAEAGTSVKTAVELLARAHHTRLPLFEGQVDNIVGVVYVKELLGPLRAGQEAAPVKGFARPVPFVPENKPIAKLMRDFQEHKVQLAIVVDEYGGVDGLVTTEDLLEEIVGEIQESGETEEAPIRAVGEGVVEALGRASLYDVAETLGVELSEGDYDSVAGWVTTALGTIPHPGEKARIEGLDVEILSADKKRIHRVRVRRPPVPSEKQPEPPAEAR